MLFNSLLNTEVGYENVVAKIPLSSNDTSNTFRMHDDHSSLVQLGVLMLLQKCAGKWK